MKQKKETYYSTEDYSQFSLFKDDKNRGIKQSIVNSFIELIEQKKFFFPSNPIVVNKTGYILDGQHRFLAAKTMNIPIYYIITDEIDILDVAMINSNVHRWTILDYVNYHTALGRREMGKIKNLLIEWGVSIGVAQVILAINSKEYTDAIKNGSFVLSKQKEERAQKLYSLLKDYSKYFDYWQHRGFIMAVRKVMDVNGFDHKIMLQKMSLHPRSLVRCALTEDYFNMLIELYNYRNQKKIKALYNSENK